MNERFAGVIPPDDLGIGPRLKEMPMTCGCIWSPGSAHHKQPADGRGEAPTEKEHKADHLPDLHEVIRGLQSAADDEQHAISQNKAGQQIRWVEISRECSPGQGKRYIQEKVGHGAPPITACSANLNMGPAPRPINTVIAARKTIGNSHSCRFAPSAVLAPVSRTPPPTT